MGRRPKGWLQPDDPLAPVKKAEPKDYEVYVKAEKLNSGWVCTQANKEKSDLKRFAFSDHEEFLDQMFTFLSKSMDGLPTGQFLAFHLAVLVNPVEEKPEEEK